jgi:Flp pilus assembly protein CpaB
MNNPIRNIFLALAKMPPAIMLLIIIGLAVVVTMMVTDTVSDSEREYRRVQAASQDRRSNSSSATQVVCARSYIPAGSKIEEKQIEMRDFDQLQVWEDAVTTTKDVVDHATKHAIPEDAQIRQIDVE